MIPEGAHCLLTETATSILCSKIIEIIGLQNPKIIAVSPCKANIMYSMSKFVPLRPPLDLYWNISTIHASNNYIL